MKKTKSQLFRPHQTRLVAHQTAYTVSPDQGLGWLGAADPHPYELASLRNFIKNSLDHLQCRVCGAPDLGSNDYLVRNGYFNGWWTHGSPMVD